MNNRSHKKMLKSATFVKNILKKNMLKIRNIMQVNIEVLDLVYIMKKQSIAKEIILMFYNGSNYGYHL